MIPLVTLADLIANHDLTDLGPATPEEIAALKPWDTEPDRAALANLQSPALLPAWSPPKVSPRNATLLEDARNRHLALAQEIKQMGLLEPHPEVEPLEHPSTQEESAVPQTVSSPTLDLLEEECSDIEW